MKSTLILVIIFFLFFFSSQAQEGCLVKLKEINGVYTGACANGKANGLGKSVGTDQYEGQFKDGYPDGKGAYIWKDGHYFVGSYKKGKKEGKGDMYYEAANGQDSIIAGFWKNDKYIGEYEKQYIVIANTTGITKVDCRLIDNKGENINITVHQLRPTGAFINSISTLMGIFITKTDTKLNNSSITRVQQVMFPFKAIFYMSNGEYTEILFNQKGDYDVYIDMN